MSKREDPPPRDETRWWVNHHLPGGRYGAIVLMKGETHVAKMWDDSPEHLAFAKELADAMNRGT